MSSSINKALPMETKSVEPDNVEEEGEEYVLLDLESVSDLVDIPPEAPYVLSGLDTLNPVLVIDGRIKLIGHYEETVGTCIAFSENDVPPEGHLETGPSEANLFSGRSIEDPSQVARPRKEVKPVASLTKILKFRLSPDVDIRDETGPM